MTPHEIKAKELVEKFLTTTDDFANQLKYYGICRKQAKQSAIICVDRTIELLKKIQEDEHSDNFWCIENAIADELEVKQSINNL